MMQLAIFTGTSNTALAERISDALDGVSLGKVLVGAFSNGETRIRIEESVRGKDVFVIQPTCGGLDGSSVNDNLMQLLVMIDALKRGDAGCITAVIPCYGYARQERRAETRTPITAKLVANLLVTAGVKRLVTVDLHAAQIEGFFDIPVSNLYASHAMEDYLKREYKGATIVSPDAGGVARARAYAKIVQGNLAIIDKARPRPGEAEVEHIIGDVENQRCLVIDDMIDTAGTLCKGAEALMKAGARSVDACATHGVFSGKAAANLAESSIGKVIVTDSLPLAPVMNATGKIEVVSIDRLLAEAIRRIHNGDSVNRFTSR